MNPNHCRNYGMVTSRAELCALCDGPSRPILTSHGEGNTTAAIDVSAGAGGLDAAPERAAAKPAPFLVIPRLEPLKAQPPLRDDMTLEEIGLAPGDDLPLGLDEDETPNRQMAARLKEDRNGTVLDGLC